MHASVELCSDFFPRDRFHLAGVDLAHAPLDFLSPRRFDAVVRFAMQAFEQTPCKFRPVSLWQLRCLSEKFRYLASHE